MKWQENLLRNKKEEEMRWQENLLRNEANEEEDEEA